MFLRCLTLEWYRWLAIAEQLKRSQRQTWKMERILVGTVGARVTGFKMVEHGHMPKSLSIHPRYKIAFLPINHYCKLDGKLLHLVATCRLKSFKI